MKFKTKRVVLLVGFNVLESHRVLERKIGNPWEPHTVRTISGWTIIGPFGTEPIDQMNLRCLQLSEIKRNVLPTRRAR